VSVLRKAGMVIEEAAGAESTRAAAAKQRNFIIYSLSFCFESTFFILIDE
jgi:hypothetical protein